jgi:hypothetical protein
MNYKIIYDRLINFRKNNVPTTKYTETHHIVMKSLGGTDKKDNLVILTGREHYIAHLLLAKFNFCKQTIFALQMMQMRSKTNDQRPHIKSGRMYEWARNQFSKFLSSNSKGNQNSQYGTQWICNIPSRKNQKIFKHEPVPEGWTLGRNLWNKPTKSSIRQSRVCSNETRAKISEKNKISKLGNKSLTGRIWINNGIINRAIISTLPIPEGFVKGRLTKGAISVTVAH